MQEKNPEMEAARLQERLQQILILCEKAARLHLKNLAENADNVSATKDLPAQLLKLVQLLEKVQEMMARATIPGSEEGIKINPAIIMKYLDKRDHAER